jgi:serine/threonine-protein kinase
MGTYFIVMEYVEGRSLSEIIRSEGPLHPNRAAEITADVAAALGFAHRNGVVHRDVKPGNVMIDAGGHVKVADFGIAQAFATSDQANLTRAGAVMGTATYFSPEQAQGQTVDPRSDLYSLGCVLFEMLTARPPFTGDTPVAIAYKHVQERPPTPTQLGVSVPAGLEAIDMKLLAKSPVDRYQDADELRADLRRFLDGHSVLAPAVGAALAGAAAGVVIGAPMADATQAVPAATQAVPATGAVPPGGADEYYEEPRRRGSGVFIGLLILLLIALGVALFYIGSNLSKSDAKKQIAVPTVVNMPADQAVSALTSAGFKVNQVSEPNDKVQSGIVFDQDPKGQTNADEGSVVTIRVSQGVGDAEVPNVIGSAESSAISLLQNAGFVPVPQQQADDTVAKGLVISQNPNPGSKAAKGSKVIIVVSTGKPTVEIPDVTGMTPTAASNKLGQLGFKTTTREQASDTVPKGSVIGTDPEAGTKADPTSTTVVILVSSGPQATTTTTQATTTTTKPSTTTTSSSSTTTTTAASSTTSSSTP